VLDVVALASPVALGGPVPALGPEWLQPEVLIASFGALAVVGVCAIVFAETGLLVGFFLPGDSLLFTAGLLVAAGTIDTPLWLLALLVFVAAFAGDQTGYLIGRKAGPKVFQRPDSRLFKAEYVDKTYSFFDRYGARTIIIARFVPIVRTFAPVAAGVGKMHYRTFVTYNVVGALLWGVGVTLLGYWLGQIEFVRTYIEPILVLIIALSLIPVAVELLRARSRRRNASYDEAHERRSVEREDMA
jgi:membrane-associated protein